MKTLFVPLSSRTHSRLVESANAKKIAAADYKWADCFNLFHRPCSCKCGGRKCISNAIEASRKLNHSSACTEPSNPSPSERMGAKTAVNKHRLHPRCATTNHIQFNQFLFLSSATHRSHNNVKLHPISQIAVFAARIMCGCRQIFFVHHLFRSNLPVANLPLPSALFFCP